MIERFHRIDRGHMDIEETIDDAKAYTKPWTFAIHPILYDGEFMEYICPENNLDIPHLQTK